MQVLRFAIFVASLFSLKSVAFGYSLSHDYYNRYRPQYGNNVYLTQQLMGGQTDAVAAPRGNGNASKSKLSGMVLHTGIGMEHFRFIQTGIFYSNVQQTDVKSAVNDLRGHEAGAELKMVLQSPVANFIVGGGAFYGSQVFAQELQRTNVAGTGYKASLEVAYFASSNVGLLLSANRVVGSLRDKSEQNPVKDVSVTSNRVGAGINIWL